MLPERKGNRMIGDVLTSKIEALGWKSTTSIKEYIKEIVLDS